MRRNKARHLRCRLGVSPPVGRGRRQLGHDQNLSRPLGDVAAVPATVLRWALRPRTGPARSLRAARCDPDARSRHGPRCHGSPHQREQQLSGCGPSRPEVNERGIMKLTDAQQEQVITLTCELVRAESRSGQERQAVETAARWMRALGYDEVWIDEYGSVIGRRQGSGPGKNLHFDGHIDIVTATAPESWRYPPFSGQLAAGRIWGRGATDMKGPLAAMICALAFLPREAFRGTLTMSASVGA